MVTAASEGASLLQSGVVAALVAAIVSIITFLAAGRRERQDRQRQLFADAFETCVAYREFAYVVRRRVDDSTEERARISAELSEAQKRLASCEARLRVEAPSVAVRYSELVAATRGSAGVQIKEGWNAPPVPPEDTGNIVGVDLSSLIPYEDAYLLAVRDHLRLMPAWFPP